MKETLRVTATFKKAVSEDGTEHFEGTIDSTLLRGAKQKEIEVVLMPANQVPKSLCSLLKESKPAPEDLLMFVSLAEKEKGRRGRKQA